MSRSLWRHPTTHFEIVERHPRKVLLVSSVELALTEATTRLTDALDRNGLATQITPLRVPDALEPSRRVDDAATAVVLSAATVSSSSTADVVLFAQCALAPTAAHLATTTGIPVIMGPGSAASGVRLALTEEVVDRSTTCGQYGPTQ